MKLWWPWRTSKSGQFRKTIAYDDYVAGKGEAGAKLAGKFRLEGEGYVVADGDAMHFRFNT